ncbi:MAG: hypothetical protein AAFW83_07595 [Pseudomonadota bacterium]
MDALWGILPFLFFLVVFVILPRMQQQKAHEALTQQFSAIQRARKSRVIAIVHRQEPMGLLGIPVLKYIDLNDAEDVLEAIRRTPPTMPLEVILHTPGGLVLPALQIARALKAHPGPTTVFVPHYAMSGGTLIAMAADEIVLSQHAALGPIDPQIGGLPAASVLRLKEEKDTNAISDQTLILADVGEMAIRQLQSAAYELLSGTVSDNAARAVAEQLSTGRWTHDYPIIAAHAAELGLNVSTQMPSEIMDMMALFPSKLSGASVKTIDIEAKSGLRRFFARRPQDAERSAPVMPAPPATATPFADRAGGQMIGDQIAGHQPNGGHSFSYGPWNPNDLNPDQLRPGAVPRRDTAQAPQKKRFRP